jgi:hypothetical protein
MMIESEARRFIVEAILEDKALMTHERKEKAKGKIRMENKEIERSRKNLVKILGVINSVANTEGTGRDDLTYEILVQAERVIRRVSVSKS